MRDSRRVHVVKRPGSARGENKPCFSIFCLQAKSKSPDLLSRPQVWLTRRRWLACCHPAMSCGAEDGRSSWQRLELPCSSQLSLVFFFHMGAPLLAGRDSWSRGDVPVNQQLQEKDQGWQMCQWYSWLLHPRWHSLWYTHFYFCTCSASPDTHTHSHSSGLRQWVKHRKPFCLYHSMNNYTVFQENTQFNSACSCYIPWERAWFDGSVALTG